MLAPLMMEQSLQDVFQLQTRKLDSECSITMGVQFADVPLRFPCVIQSQAQGESAQVLQEEILSLLEKGPFSIVAPKQSVRFFFTRYFFIPIGNEENMNSPYSGSHKIST